MNKILGIIDEDGFPIIPEVTLINPVNNYEIKPKTIIDTGAIELHIKAEIIKSLELEKIDGTFTLHPIHGRQTIDVFKAAIKIQGIEFGPVTVMTMLNNFPFDLIIGCSFIRDGKMIYDGANKTVEINI